MLSLFVCVTPLSSSSLCIRIVFLDHSLIQSRHLIFLFVSLYSYRLFRPSYGCRVGPHLPLRLFVFVSSFKTILRIENRHLIFLFVSLYSYRRFRPFYGYEVDTTRRKEHKQTTQEKNTNRQHKKRTQTDNRNRQHKKRTQTDNTRK